MIHVRNVVIKKTPPAIKLGNLCLVLVTAVLLMAHGPAIVAHPLTKEAGVTMWALTDYFEKPRFGELRMELHGASGDAKNAKKFNQLHPKKNPVPNRKELRYR